MKKVNQLKVFGIIVAIFVILITIGYTMQREGNDPLPIRVLNDGVAIVQRGYIGLTNRGTGLFSNVRQLFNTFEENRLLRQRMYNAEMLRIQNKLLREEIESLKTAIDTGATLTEFETIFATTISRYHWHDSFMVNRGRRDGIVEEMAVLSKEGYLVGKVVQVNELSARVQLIKRQNLTMKAHVIVAGNPDAMGLLEGYDYTANELVVINIPPQIEVEIGDAIVTSGLGGVYPRGLLVGYVKRVEMSSDNLTQILYLTNGVDYNNLDFVALIRREAVIPEDD